jgi:hypothetical protein
MFPYKFLLVVFLVICIASDVVAQPAQSSFSSFGVGEMVDPAQANVQGMGGVGVSNPQFWYINNINPALLVFNNFTTFQAGINGESRTASNGEVSHNSQDGNMNYLMLGFPLRSSKKHPSMSRWSTSLSLAPYSVVNYSFSYIVPIEGSPGNALFRENGSGGINQLAWSHGIALTKFLSVGLKGMYLFSSIENNFAKTVSISSDQLVILTSNSHKRYTYKDFAFTGGISLHLDSLGSKLYRFNLGGVYNMDANVRTDYFETLQRYSQGGSVLSTDTLVTTRLGDTFIPGSFAVGMSFGRQETWTFGVDAKVSDFTNFSAFEKTPTPTHVGWKVSAGLELTPDPTSISSYLKRMTYRTGVSFEESPFLVNDNPLRDFGINFGLSAPVARFSSVDLGLRWGSRGNIADNTIEEKYFKIYFGITFNDRWFTKRRFD